MQKARIPLNEAERLAALRQAGLLDTAAEERFDRLTRLVQRYFEVDIVLVSLVDEERQWFKSKQGLEACETGRDIAFCAHAILSSDILVVPDTRQDPRFADNPLVVGPPNIAFYAGAPIFLDGQALGTLCIIDTKPRTLNQQQIESLRDFANAIEQEIHDRLEERAQQQLAEREFHYRAVLEGTRIGTWQWNVQTGETVFNPRWAEIIGYTLEELAPISIETWQRFAHPEDLERSAAALERHFKGEAPFYDVECRMRHKDGHWVWVHDRGQVFERTEDGEPLLMFGTHVDISEQVTTERQLVSQKQLFEQILEQTMAGYWDWQLQENTEYLSPTFKQMFGYADDELENSPEAWQQIIFQDDLPQVLTSFDNHVATHGQTPFDNIVRYHHKDGSTVWVRCIGQVIEWSGDTPIRMVGSHIDLTEQMKAKQALQESKDQFEALVNNIPGITYRCLADDAWTMQYMSGDIDPLSGYPASDFINNTVRSYASVIHPDDRNKLEEEVAKHIEERTSWLLNYRIIHNDGSIRFVEERGAAEYDDDGNVRYLDGFVLDVTNAKQLKRQLMALAEQIPGVIYQYQQWPDGSAAFPFASDKIEAIYGVTPEQVKHDASAAFDAILPADLESIAASIEVSRQQLSVWEHEYRVRDNDGDIKWLLGRATPERMPDDSVVWHGYIYDITETKQHYLDLERANEQLHLAQSRLDLSSRQAQIGYWQASLKSGALWWSDMIYELFGFQLKTTEPSVDLFKQAVHPDDLELVEASERRAQETGLHDVVHRIIRQDGEVRWVHELAQMLPESSNPELIMIGTVQDVTERMRLQQMKDEFIATVSHELRTPLTSICGALKLIQVTQSNAMTDKGQSLVTVANNNAQRLLRLINDLLDVEKLIAGKMRFDVLSYDVVSLVEQAIMDHTTYADKFGMELVLKNNLPAVDTEVLVDESRFQQIMANLLSNAIKFSPEASDVEVKLSLQSGMCEIEVADQGPGISADYQTRLFKRFSQADSSDTKSKGGTGLGLALAKELVENMNGSIGYRANNPTGACFYVRLPTK